MAESRRSSEAKRLRPFMAATASGGAAETSNHDGRYSLLTHLHDDRYYTEIETNGLLSYKVDKTLTLTAGDGLTGGGNLSGNRTFAVGAGDGISVAVDAVAVDSTVVRTTRTLPAGNGLTGGGDLSANRTFAVGQGFGLTVTADAVEVNLTANFSWTGSHTFSGSLTTGSIMPALSDVFDLGDYTKPWRKIWGSELSAVVFSQYEQMLLGGWLTISKGEGKLPAAINGADTILDLGGGVHAYANGDILVFRSISSNGTPQVEYIRIDSWSGGSVYGVTRDLDGTGGNDWPEGTVYGNWGQVGNGRVELNAYDTPRMSVYSHGAAIADFREQLRFGDLNGGWGYSSSVFGGAFGAYESGKANITIDPTNGIRIRNYDQDVIKLTGTTASFENFITLGANGGIRQGSGTWVNPPGAGNTFTGTALWAESSIMNIGGWNAGVKQWWGGSDGKFYAGEGVVELNGKGISIIHNEIGNTFPNSELKFYYSDTTVDTNKTLSFFVSGYNQSNACNSYSRIYLENKMIKHPLNTNPRIVELDISANVPYNVNDYSKLYLRAYGPNPAQIQLFSWGTSSTLSSIFYDADWHSFGGCIVVHAISATNADLSTQSPTNTLAYHAPDGHYFTGKLNVTGDAAISGKASISGPIYSNIGLYVKGPGNTSATNSLWLESNDTTDTFKVNDAGDAYLKGTLTLGANLQSGSAGANAITYTANGGHTFVGPVTTGTFSANSILCTGPLSLLDTNHGIRAIGGVGVSIFTYGLPSGGLNLQQGTGNVWIYGECSAQSFYDRP